MFTDAERAFLKTQHLARIATASPDGQPDVAAVGFGFDGETFSVTGYTQRKTMKHLNVLQGNPRVALVIDELASVEPGRPRMLKIYGRAEIVQAMDHAPFVVEGEPLLKITPDRKWSFGIESEEVPPGES